MVQDIASLGDAFRPFTEKRPWGEFRQLTPNGVADEGDKGKGKDETAGAASLTVKILIVKKGQAFSLQKHRMRAEFWHVLSGTPDVTVGREQTGTLHVVRAKAGDEFTIPSQCEHRISAVEDDAEILEIARGVFDENDIVRLEDKYGRV